MVEIGRIKTALLKHGTHRSYDELLLLKSYLAQSEFVKNTLSVGLFPKQLDELCRSLLLETVDRGDRVIRQNAVADKMFIVLSGSCEVKVKHKVELAHGESEVREKTVFVCLPGMHFGERALMKDEPRAASVYAKESSDLIIITKQAYNSLLKGAVADSNAMAAKSEQPGTKAHLMKVLGKKRDDRTKLEIEAVAGYLNWRIPFFRKFTPEQQLELCRVSEAVSIYGETVLFKQGTIGEAFYVILTGSVEVWVATQEEMAVMMTLAQSAAKPSSSASKNAGSVNPLKSGLGSKVAMLSVGDTFGERALENEDSLRMASIVTCESQTDLLVISREDYYKLVSALTNSALMDKITILRRTDMFRNTDATYLREMAKYMVPVRYEIDQYLFHEGTKATQMIIIETGEVMVEVQVKTYSAAATKTTQEEIGYTSDAGDESSLLTADVQSNGEAASTQKVEVRARLHNTEIIELGRVAPNSVLAQYVTQAASPGEKIIHPESVRATTLVKAYTLGIHDFYSNMNKESKTKVVKIIANHVRSSIPALWEQIPRRFGQKEWHQQAAWKKYKEHIRDKNKSLTYAEALQIYSNIFVTPDSGNLYQNRHGAISNVHVPDFITTLEKDGNAVLTEEDLAYTQELEMHALDDEASTYSVDSATIRRRAVTMTWGTKQKEKKRETASKQLGVDITSTHPVVSRALASDAKREKQRLLDTIRGASAKSSSPAAAAEREGGGSVATKRTLTTNGSIVENLKGSEIDDDIRRYAFSLIHFHQEIHSATPATIGVNRLLSLHLRHCGTMKSCDDAKRAANKQMQEALILLFDSDLSKADQLSLKWRSFKGFESVALDNSDIIVVYCRSVPVEYACINPDRNLLDMVFPSFCKQKRQFFSCMRMKSIQMPKVVAPDGEISLKKKRSKKKPSLKANEYGIEYADTDDDDSVGEETMIARDKRLQAEGLPSTSKYKVDKFALQMSQPLMLHELGSFAETLATSTTHGGSLRYGKVFETSQQKKDPFMVLTGLSTLPSDLFHGQQSVSQGLSRPGTRTSEIPASRGVPRRDTSLLDANSALLSPKPKMEESPEVEYICVLPLYQWIVLEEDTVRKYDITQIPSADSPLTSADRKNRKDESYTSVRGSLPFGNDSPESPAASASQDLGAEQNARHRRMARLRGRDSVDTAFFEAGMTSMKESGTGNRNETLPAVDPSVIRDLEKHLATKDLAKTIERFQTQEVEDEARLKEERKLHVLMRRASMASKSVASSVGGMQEQDQSSVSTVGSSSHASGMQKSVLLPSKGKSHSGSSINTGGNGSTNTKSDDRLLDFVPTEEKGQALTEVMRERVRMIRMNDKLCRDEGRLKPLQKKKVRLGSGLDTAESSDEEDDTSWGSSVMASGDIGEAITKKDYKRGVSYRGHAASSGAFEPGGMGLLGQRMNMYEALNHLPPSRTVVERELLRAKSLSALSNNKKNKVGGASALSNSHSIGDMSISSDDSSERHGMSSEILGQRSSDSILERGNLTMNLSTLTKINSLANLSKF